METKKSFASDLSPAPQKDPLDAAGADRKAQKLLREIRAKIDQTTAQHQQIESALRELGSDSRLLTARAAAARALVELRKLERECHSPPSAPTT